MNLYIVEKKKIWFLISVAIMVVGLVIGIMQGLNFGIDFSGGTMIHINMGKVIEPSEVKEITSKYNLDADIIHAGYSKNEIIIKTKINLPNEDRVTIFNDFKEKYNLTDDDLLEAEQFSPSIGKEIRDKALLAIIIAAIGMLIYITLRFEIKFALAAICALLHDILILLAFYAIFRVPINSPFIAALLTIVGYSINDTIVVFDRIRENIKGAKKKYYSKIVNNSVKQTINRSINTSFTTLITIACLYILGVDSIREFALPLIAGVISGTYSSIFIASPVWYILTNIGNKTNYAAR